MKWQEMSVLQKIIFISGYVCLGVALLLRILMDVGVLPYIGEIVMLFLGPALTAISLPFWKQHRVAAIACIIFGMAYLGYSIFCLLT